MMRTFHTEQDFLDFATEFARALKPGDVIGLSGPLGAGKTTFVRGLAAGLGCGGDVMSPTFQLVRVYRGRVQLAHADLYRLERTAELADLGLEELLEEGVVAVEWGDRIAPEGAARVVIEPLGETDSRKLRLEGGRPDWSWS
jgi:tRNA threonylcarbamoyl adenosine modification protein YjeE